MGIKKIPQSIFLKKKWLCGRGKVTLHVGTKIIEGSITSGLGLFFPSNAQAISVETEFTHFQLAMQLYRRVRKKKKKHPRYRNCTIMPLPGITMAL